jgi:hypothetical protein
MAGRPVQKRDQRTYARDIEHLSRLRIAIQLDSSLDVGKADKACKDIDRLTKSILELVRGLEVSA